MKQSPSRSPYSLRVVVAAVALACSALAVRPSLAQSAQASSAAAKAEQEGDKVFKWIIMHADKPRRTAEAKPAPAPAPAPRAVARVKDEGITERVSPITPPAPRTAAASPTKTPAAAVAAVPALVTDTVAKTAPPAPQPAVTGGAPANDALALAPATTTPQPAPPAPAASEPEEPEEEPLILVKSVDPEFPRSRLSPLGKGTVQVRFEVMPDGKVQNVEVVKSNEPRYNRSATEAVAQWQFKPVHHTQYGAVEMVFNPDE